MKRFVLKYTPTITQPRACPCVSVCASPCLESLMSGLSFLIRPVWCFSSEWRRVTSQCKASYVCCMLLSLQEDGTFLLNIIIIKELVVVVVVRNIQLSYPGPHIQTHAVIAFTQKDILRASTLFLNSKQCRISPFC